MSLLLELRNVNRRLCPSCDSFRICGVSYRRTRARREGDGANDALEGFVKSPGLRSLNAPMC